MRATGIVRRIDDLGRVVIPKEIRRTLRIREGDPLEIFTDRQGEVILKKYSPIGELGTFAKEYAEALAQGTGHMVCICDHDQIIAAAGGSKKDFVGKNISSELEMLIDERKNILSNKNENNYVRLTKDDMEENAGQVIWPIISANISSELEMLIDERKNILSNKNENNYVRLTKDDMEENAGQVIWPIISAGDAIGAVILLGKEGKRMGETENLLAKCASSFMGKQMES